jgi:hypothetical protein
VTGVTKAVAGPPGFPLFGRPRWWRAGDFVLHRTRSVSREFESDLSHSVRLDQYYPAPAAAYSVWRLHPAGTSVIMERCFGAASSFST